VDMDGSEQIDHIVITGLPEGATLSAGSAQLDGSVHLTEAELTGLTLQPATDDDNDFVLSVQIHITDTDSDTGAQDSAYIEADLAVSFNDTSV
ncbi:hypothetical protein, partial [Oleiphilus sp. HI0066]